MKAQLVSMTRGAGGGAVEPGMPDFALLKLPQAVPGAQPLALTPTADKLLDVVAAGYPASVVQVEQGMQELQQGRLGTPPELVLTRGSISTIQRLENGLVVMPHSADISAGNSGGPLFNTAGEVIGINTAIYSPSGANAGIGFATPSDLARPVIETLRRDGRVERGWLGVSVQDLVAEDPRANPRAVLIGGVGRTGPAGRGALPELCRCRVPPRPGLRPANPPGTSLTPG